MRNCVNEKQKFSIAKYKNYLALARGNIDISVEGTHDTVIKLLN